MKYNLLALSLGLTGMALTHSAWAEEVERIEVHGQTSLSQSHAFQAETYHAPDPGELVKQLPGANINRNGPLTPIAQYRGLYGDRVNVQVNGVSSVGAGPNAMDTPLSYVPMALLERVQQHRGVAPVNQGINTLGGAYQVELRKPELANNDQLLWNGAAQLGYQDNGEVLSGLGWLEVADDSQALQLSLERQKANESLEAGNGDSILPTHYQKSVGHLGYTQALNRGQWSVAFQHFDTGFSGTPALPMDINYVKTNRLALAGEYELADWQLKGRLNLGDADHLMDNFSQRANGSEGNKLRQNLALADDWSWHFNGVTEWGKHQLELGMDGLNASHDSTITDPSNAMFRVLNFNNVRESHASLYGYWRQEESQYNLSGGVRVKRSQTNAGEVSHHMADKSAGIGKLVAEFNQAERKQTDWLVDVNLQLDWALSDTLQATFAIARKQKAPDYQQRYLWFPLEATAGLADGLTYTGKIDLKPETAWQIDYGLRWQSDSAYIEPHVFYQRIDDYIQGAPSSNATAVMVGEMMSNKTPLQFANVDAELYGLDVVGHWQLAEQWDLDGSASLVRGERRDIQDNLYRIAPPSMRLQLSYQNESWLTQLNWQLVDRQRHVSQINQEQKTSGYGLLGLSAHYRQANWSMVVGIDNLLDKAYQDHLGGYNRVMMVDTPVMERLPGTGRNLYVKWLLML